MGTGTVWLWGTSSILQQVQLHSCLLIQSHLSGENGAALLNTPKKSHEGRLYNSRMTPQRQFSGHVFAFQKARYTFRVQELDWFCVVSAQTKKRNKPFTKSATSFLLILMRLGRSHQISRVLSRSLKTGEKCSNISINNSALFLPELGKHPLTRSSAFLLQGCWALISTSNVITS